jgi:hypothetical protein
MALSVVLLRETDVLGSSVIAEMLESVGAQRCGERSWRKRRVAPEEETGIFMVKFFMKLMA